MLKQIILVGAGGFIGTVARYGVGRMISAAVTSGIPWGTLAVNAAGCLVMGMVWQGSARDGDWRLFLATGICGGFTTFSAFAAENLGMIQSGQAYGSVAYSLISVMLGIGCMWLGTLLFRQLF